MIACRPMAALSRRELLVAVAPSFAAGQGRGFEEVALYRAGDGGYHTFRIPALLTVSSGTVLAFCEGRRFSRGDSGEIDLVSKRSEDGGLTWSPLQVVWSDPPNTCGNPCPVEDDRTGRILLPMTWNAGTDNGRELHLGTGVDTRRVFLAHSADDGRSWSQAREITSQAKRPDWWWYATGPGVGIQIRDGEHAGRIVIPANHTSDVHGYAAHAILSDDGGENWALSSVISPGCNESQVVELSDGRLMMNCRTQSFTNRERTGYRAVAFSSDGGETWSAPRPDPHLGDPRVQASLFRYSWPGPGGPGRVLFSNPSPPISKQPGERVRMTVQESRDNCRTWPVSRLVHRGPAAYSSLARLPDDRVGLLYEAGEKSPYEEIRMARFSIDWLAAGP